MLELEKKIIWVKWVDPLAHLVHQDKENRSTDSEEEDDDLEHQAATDSYLDDEEYRYNKFSHENAKGDTGPTIVGPMGIVCLHESNIPSKLYNFWMGHSNFDITNRIARTISQTPGVESIDVFSRYRFRIAIGKAFKHREVKLAIDARVCPATKFPKAAMKQVPSASSAERMKGILAKQYASWAIGEMPGGTFEVAGGDTREEVEEKMKKFAERAIKVTTSW